MPDCGIYVILYDYACLAEGEWLTDTVIDIYARYVDSHNLLAFHRFNCRMYRVIITYPLSPSEGGIDVYPSDYACLAEGEWLTDTVIACDEQTASQLVTESYCTPTCCLERSVHRRSSTDTCSDVYFITSCPTAPLTKTRHEMVKSMTGAVDLSKKEFLKVNKPI
jgi:hypothetical protein